jgi:hypothetical protein
MPWPLGCCISEALATPGSKISSSARYGRNSRLRSGETLNQVNAQGFDFVYIDAPYSEFSCTDCHTGGPQK